MNYKYTVLTFIFGNYEYIREIEHIETDIEYICVTDNKELISNTWTIIYDEDLEGKGVFDKCLSVRYNPFKYCSTDLCVRIDGSFQINKSLTPIVEEFIKSDQDICLAIHPYRDSIIEEYNIWNIYRDYPNEKIQKHLDLFERLNYDFNKKGFIAIGFSILKNIKINNDLNRITYDIQRLLGDEQDVDRLDQTTITVILDKFFPEIKIFTVSLRIIHSEFITWCLHGSNTPIEYIIEDEIKTPHLNDTPVIYNDCNFINYD